ncbi:hypothetical protein [Halobacillus sp. B29]|uniref:hypothetical protein n=1 Tax=Halobacillus sp. B29 TaxID=3457432 RepID=UPI003FCEB531
MKTCKDEVRKGYLLIILKVLGPPIFLTGVILLLGPIFDYSLAERVSAVVIATLFCYLQIYFMGKKNKE